MNLKNLTDQMLMQNTQCCLREERDVLSCSRFRNQTELSDLDIGLEELESIERKPNFGQFPKLKMQTRVPSKIR
jgi:hypothetical protein